MDLSDVRSTTKRKARKRIGRGIAAGQGKTAGRGEAGQKHRYKIAPGFEGGQTPLYRRIPRLRGKGKASHNTGMFGTEYAVVNIGTLGELFEAGAEIDADALVARRIVRKPLDGLKVLGQGELDKALHIKADRFSAGAREKIEAAGGTAEVIEG